MNAALPQRRTDLPMLAQRHATRPSYRWQFALCPLIYTPLFICLPNGAFPILHLFGFNVTRDSINLNLNVAVCLAGFVGFLFSRVGKTLLHYTLFLLGWLTLSLAWGLTMAPSMTNVLFYAQTVLPLFATIFGYQLIRTERDINRFLKVSIATGAATAVLLVAAAVGCYGPKALMADRLLVMSDLAFAIPQFKSYFPLCVLASFSLCLSKYLFEGANRGREALIYLGMQSLFVPLCWSRSGLLGFALCAAIQITILAVGSARGNLHRIGLMMAALAIVLPTSFAYLGNTISSRTDIHSLDNKSDRARLELAIEGLHRAYDQPLFGDAFIPTMDERVGGEEIDVPRMFGAHNQWVDMLLRAGFVYVFAFAALYCKSMRASYVVAHRRNQRLGSQYAVFGIGVFSYLASAAISANFQLYFIQLQTATPIFVLLGMAFRVHELAVAKTIALNRQAAAERKTPRVAAPPTARSRRAVRAA